MTDEQKQIVRDVRDVCYAARCQQDGKATKKYATQVSRFLKNHFGIKVSPKELLENEMLLG